MSEITYIKCDGSGCDRQLPKSVEIDLEEQGWTKDDMDADFCPDCTAVARDLEANTASPEELAAFGQVVSAEADKAEREKLGVPLVGPMVTEEEFQKALEATIKNVKKDLKKQGQTKTFIDETVKLIREQAAEMRKA